MQPTMHLFLWFVESGSNGNKKQVIAYNFASKTVQTANLKFLIKEIISQLQDIRLNVLSTVCAVLRALFN
jgi:hypothetical protein